LANHLEKFSRENPVALPRSHGKLRGIDPHQGALGHGKFFVFWN